jgi:hypothetical protein
MGLVKEDEDIACIVLRVSIIMDNSVWYVGVVDIMVPIGTGRCV